MYRHDERILIFFAEFVIRRLKSPPVSLPAADHHLGLLHAEIFRDFCPPQVGNGVSRPAFVAGEERDHLVNCFRIPECFRISVCSVPYLAACVIVDEALAGLGLLAEYPAEIISEMFVFDIVRRLEVSDGVRLVVIYDHGRYMDPGSGYLRDAVGRAGAQSFEKRLIQFRAAPGSPCCQCLAVRDREQRCRCRAVAEPEAVDCRSVGLEITVGPHLGEGSDCCFQFEPRIVILPAVRGGKEESRHAVLLAGVLPVPLIKETSGILSAGDENEHHVPCGFLRGRNIADHISYIVCLISERRVKQTCVYVAVRVHPVGVRIGRRRRILRQWIGRSEAPETGIQLRM